MGAHPALQPQGVARRPKRFMAPQLECVNGSHNARKRQSSKNRSHRCLPTDLAATSVWTLVRCVLSSAYASRLMRSTQWIDICRSDRRPKRNPAVQSMRREMRLIALSNKESEGLPASRNDYLLYGMQSSDRAVWRTRHHVWQTQRCDNHLSFIWPVPRQAPGAFNTGPSYMTFTRGRKCV